MVNIKTKPVYYASRLLLLTSQFFLYRYMLSYSDTYQIRQFIYFSTLISLFGLTDFGFSIYVQRICSMPEISLDSSRRLIGAGFISIGVAAIFSILSAFLYFMLDISSISFSLGLFLSLLLGIFALNVAYLVSSSFCRIGFSSPTHGYTGSLIMAIGPLVALILLICGHSFSIHNLQNPSIVFVIGSSLSFTLTIIYISRHSPKAHCLFRSIYEFSLSGADYLLGPQFFYDWTIGSLGTLTLQSDILIVLLLKSQNLTSYFLVVKSLAIFAFLSSITLPRVFSTFAENPTSNCSAILLRRYVIKSRILPLVALPATIVYLYFLGQVSTLTLMIAFILNIVLYMRIMTDLFSCILQARGQVRVLIAYLPFQFIVTSVFGVLLGNQFNSLGVAFAQLIGFSLIAYPWLRYKYNSLLYSNFCV